MPGANLSLTLNQFLLSPAPCPFSLPAVVDLDELRAVCFQVFRDPTRILPYLAGVDGLIIIVPRAPSRGREREVFLVDRSVKSYAEGVAIIVPDYPAV
ncbi:MAG: hypothetical protein M1339_00655, partial [Bacteroidetes bacterium]|nr:hypothetical protein [Bacteroidota bacterium]